MSFRAILDIDGTEYRVLHANYSLQRDTDFSGRPSSDVRGGSLHVEIESHDDTSFFEWICDPYTLKSGKITFYKRDEEAAMKELEFEDAYLVSYAESVDAVGDNPMTESLVFSAKKISMGGASHENEWPS